MDQDVIKALEKRAKLVGLHYSKVKGKDWAEFNGTFEKIDFPKPGMLVFWVNKYANLAFVDIQPSKVTKQIFHDPLLLNQKVSDSNVAIVENASEDVILERTYDYAVSETKTMSEHVGVATEITFTQKVGYGSPGGSISGESSLSLSVSSSYNKEWGESKTVSRDTSTTIEVPPLTKASVVSLISKGDYEQKCEYWGDLEHQIVTWSHHDYHHERSSMSALKDLLLGKSPDSVLDGKWWRENKLSEALVEEICAPLDIHFEVLLEYKNTTTGDIKVSSKSITLA